MFGLMRANSNKEENEYQDEANGNAGNVIKKVICAGLEPTTFGFGIRCSTN